MNITKVISKFFRISAGAVLDAKHAETLHSVENTGSKSTNLFCHDYWKCVDLRDYVKISGRVTYHEYLNGINHHLTSSVNPQHMTQIFNGTKLTPKEMIKLTDMEFKALPKTKDTITCYRCIGEKPEFFKQDYARYTNSLKVKEGDIIRMPEYAYATSDIDYANIYLNNNRGIMYIIEIPPESQISITGHGINNEVVFPRSSLFKCTGKEQKEGIQLIKLKYVKPINFNV